MSIRIQYAYFKQQCWLYRRNYPVALQPVLGGALKQSLKTGDARVPTVGVAVIIGVTAWDLKWSCDTMKDMRAIETVFDPTIQQGEQETQVCGLKVPTKAEVLAKAGSMTKWVGDKGRGALDTAKDYIPSMPDVTLPSMPDFELPELRLPW